jgi:hypothetical protein
MWRPLWLFCESLRYGLAGVEAAGLLAAGLAAGADDEDLIGYCWSYKRMISWVTSMLLEA